MALNWVMIASDGKSPVPLPGEKILFRQEKVNFLLEIGGPYYLISGYPGNPGDFKAEGNIFITNQRVIFISRPSLPDFKSLSIPLLNLREGKLQQPWFGANYYQANLMPVQNGGLPSPGQMKITFKEGGGYDFSSCYTELIQRLTENDGFVHVEHTEPLPTYTPREDSTSPLTTTQTSTAASDIAAPMEPPFINATSPFINATSPSQFTFVRSPDELPPSYDEIAI
ncbi:11064_t:CDS:2 [Scutellospora calospora]|uniref:11064_t:CDS:1 n=1 Tax=Scutellospora calospora TaxID=85575 RepID=A0ACA9KR05_9GLOM|nr:11064_t:CDS:2 [Scutellospora calospora]